MHTVIEILLKYESYNNKQIIIFGYHSKTNLVFFFQFVIIS